jgi:hypothetical protein
MKARKTRFFLVTLAIVCVIVFSSFSAAYANVSKSTIADVTPSGNMAPVVRSHKITASELQAMENKLGVSVEGQDYNDVVDGHGTGLRAPTASEWQEISQTAQITDSVTLPSAAASVDNSLLPWFPPVGNQGSEGACVGFSVGYYAKTFQEAKEHGWNLSGATCGGSYPGYPTPTYQDRIMSPEFIYHLINAGTNNGGSFQDAINLVCNIGVSSWQKMPYSQVDHTSWPSEAAWAEAPYYRGNASGYQHLSIDTTSGIQTLKNLLASGILVSIGIDADLFSGLTSNDFWTLDNYAPAGASSINHANTIVGYDDSITYYESGLTRQGAFKVVNSWGIGSSWEHVADGFYWISYEAMRLRVGLTSDGMFCYDMNGYQPELVASFKLSHAYRGECQITVGVGSTTSPIATKVFTQYIDGGSFPFPFGNMMLDITEFKSRLPLLTNQTYFLKVRDTGTTTVGTVTSFSIGNVSSPDAPRATIQNSNVYLTLYYSVTTAELTVSPTSGPPGALTTLSGSGFTPNRTVNISYLNPVTSKWVSIINNTATNAQGQFDISITAPDLMMSVASGDNAEASDAIVLRATDGGSGVYCNSTVPFSESRRGLTLVGASIAVGLFGNNTDLTSRVAVVSNQTLTVEGKWFSPGNVTLLWDGTANLGTALANETGSFNAAFTIPSTMAGRHEIVLRNGNVEFHVSLARLAFTTNDYDGSWHMQDFTVHLTSDAGNSTTYYSINGGQVCSVPVDGQPVFTNEGGENVLEYWSVDQFGNEESPHQTLTQVKLDKTAPQGSLQIGNRAKYTNTGSVTLNLTASDAVSGVKQVRLSNDGVWDTESWEIASAARSWTLTSGDGLKTVYLQIMDNAGLTASYSAQVTLDTTKPTLSLGQSQGTTAGSPVAFTPNECTDSGGISSGAWDFGDGTTANGTTATHTYLAAGSYIAVLTVQDFAGNVATSSVTVTVQNKIGSTGGGTVPEFSAVFLLPIMIAGVLVAVVMKRKSLGTFKSQTIS